MKKRGKVKIKAFVDGSKIKREIDFQGALLPDGRSIDAVLDENKNLKNQLTDLEKKLKETSSILSLIRNRKIRVTIEIVLILLSVIGILLVL